MSHGKAWKLDLLLWHWLRGVCTFRSKSFLFHGHMPFFGSRKLLSFQTYLFIQVKRHVSLYEWIILHLKLVSFLGFLPKKSDTASEACVGTKRTIRSRPFLFGRFREQKALLLLRNCRAVYSQVFSLSSFVFAFLSMARLDQEVSRSISFFFLPATPYLFFLSILLSFLLVGPVPLFAFSSPFPQYLLSPEHAANQW